MHADSEYVTLVLSQLDSTRRELELIWKFMLLLLAAGLAVLSCLDAVVLEALGLAGGGDGADGIERAVLARIVVAALLLFYFFRFGIVLGEFRDRRMMAEIVVKDFAEGRERIVAPDILASTNSQFEVLVSPRNHFVVWLMQLITAVLIGLMHAVGTYLLYSGVAETGAISDFKAGIVSVVYVGMLGVLYAGHIHLLLVRVRRGDRILNLKPVLRRSVVLASVAICAGAIFFLAITARDGEIFGLCDALRSAPSGVVGRSGEGVSGWAAATLRGNAC